MNKELLKISVTAIFSILATVIIMSFTVLRSKADKTYVDKQDDKIDTRIDEVKRDYRAGDQELKKDIYLEVQEIKEANKEIQKDIKEILKKL